MKNRKGVTLIELMIYSFLSFFVIALILNAFLRTNKGFFEQRSALLNLQDAREAINYLGFDLQRVGLKFYYYKDSVGNYRSGIVNYASYPDYSSFNFVDQKTSKCDEFTYRALLLNDDGQPVDKDGKPIDMSDPLSKNNAIVEEVRYYVDDQNRLHKEIKKISYSGGIEKVESTEDYTLVDNILAFQVEFGLVGSKKVIRNKSDIINPANWELSKVTYNINGIELSVENKTQTVFDFSYGVNGNIDLEKGSQYTIAFNVKGEGDIIDKLSEIAVVLKKNAVYDTLGKVTKIGSSFVPVNFIYESGDSASNAELKFVVKTNDMLNNGKLFLSNLFLLETRKGKVYWVGDEVGKKIWEENEGDYFVSHTQGEWDSNKVNVRLLRVSLISATNRELSAQRKYNYKLGNIIFDTTTNKEMKFYRTLVPIEANGVFPTTQNVLGGTSGNLINMLEGSSSSISVSSSLSSSVSSSSSIVSSSSSSSVSGTQYNLTISTDGMGSVTPTSGAYNSGDVVNLTAKADPGWVFDHWIGDVSDPTSATTQITMDANKDVTAVFKQLFTITVSATNGTVNLDPNKATYKDGETVELTAVGDPGYVFDHWEGDITGTANPYSFIVSQNYNITAVFSQVCVLTNKIDDKLATVKIDGNIIAYNDDYTVKPNSNVDIEVIPKSGYSFVKWINDLETEGSQSTLLGYNVTTSIDLEAIIGGPIALYHFEGDAQDATIFANNGSAHNVFYKLSCIDAKGAYFSGSNSYIDICNLTIDGEQLTISAWIMPYQLSNDAEIIGKATGTTSNDYIWGLSIKRMSNKLGELKFILKTNNGSYEVSGGTIEVDKWNFVTATYDGSVIKIFVNSSQVNSMAASGNIDNSSANVRIGANAQSASVYAFNGIIDELEIDNIAKSSSDIVNLYNNGVNCKDVNLTLQVSGNGTVYINSKDSVTANSSATFVFGKYREVSLVANPISGNLFTGWTGDINNTTNPYVFQIDSDKNITANFAENSYVIDVQTKTEGTIGGTDRNYYMWVKIINKSSTTLDLNGKEFIYYFNDSQNSSYQFYIRNVNSSNGWIGDNPSFISKSLSGVNDGVFCNEKVVLDFGSDNRIKLAQNQRLEFKIELQGNNAAINETDDYSFINSTSYQSNNKVVLFENNKVIYGVPQPDVNKISFSITNGGGENKIELSPASLDGKSEVLSSRSVYYYNGTNVQLVARGKFKYWLGDLSGSDFIHSILIDQDKNIGAEFDAPSTPGSSPSNPIVLTTSDQIIDVSAGFVYVSIPVSTSSNIAIGNTGQQFSVKLIRVNQGTSETAYNSWFQAFPTNGEILFKVEILNGVTSIVMKYW